MTAAFRDAPTLRVRSADGTLIAVFEAQPRAPVDGAAGRAARPPLLLVHGTTADHTTFRIVAPLLASRRWVLAMDRRGRGASGDGAAYSIEREFEDVAAVAEALVDGNGGRSGVDVVGHSYGGRSALGASLRTPAIRRVVSYEGAPAPPGVAYGDEASLEAIREALWDGDNERALETFFRSVVGMDDELIARYKADPVWPVRAAAAPTIVREAEAESGDVAGLEALSAVRVAVLQVLGGASAPAFGAATRALQERLRDGRIIEIEGAAHAAHHTHPIEFVKAVEAFLEG